MFEPDDFGGGGVGGTVAGVFVVVILVIFAIAVPALWGVIGPVFLIAGAVGGAKALFSSGKTPNGSKTQSGPNLFVSTPRTGSKGIGGPRK